MFKGKEFMRFHAEDRSSLILPFTKKLTVNSEISGGTFEHNFGTMGHEFQKNSLQK